MNLKKFFYFFVGVGVDPALIPPPYLINKTNNNLKH